MRVRRRAVWKEEISRTKNARRREVGWKGVARGRVIEKLRIYSFAGEVALAAEEGVLVPEVGDQRGAEALGGHVAPADQRIEPASPGAGMLGKLGMGRDLSAAVVLAQDEVDDAADGVAAVDRGSAVL